MSDFRSYGLVDGSRTVTRKRHHWEHVVSVVIHAPDVLVPAGERSRSGRGRIAERCESVFSSSIDINSQCKDTVEDEERAAPEAF